MMLQDFLQVYASRRDLQAGSLYQYRVAVDSINRWAGDPLACEEFSSETVNAWLQFLQTTRLATATIRNRRCHILALWHAAHKDGYCGRPANVRQIKATWTPPRAWSYEQCVAILDAAERVKGYYPDVRWHVAYGSNCRVKRADFWGSMIRIAWDSGLRQGDILRLRLTQLQGTGEVEVVQHKTRRWHVTRLHEETLQFVAAVEPKDRELVVPWEMTPEHFRKEFRLIVAAAKVSQGSFKKLRKSSATEVESLFPGCGSAHLGHVAGSIARQHYLDPRMLLQSKPMPRPLRTLPEGGAN